MQTKIKRLAVSLLLALQGFHHAQAQEVKPQPADPKTKLEAFQAKSGAVIIRGSSKVGTIPGQNTSLVKIDCREFTDASFREERAWHHRDHRGLCRGLCARG